MLKDYVIKKTNVMVSVLFVHHLYPNQKVQCVEHRFQSVTSRIIAMAFHSNVKMFSKLPTSCAQTNHVITLRNVMAKDNVWVVLIFAIVERVHHQHHLLLLLQLKLRQIVLVVVHLAISKIVDNGVNVVDLINDVEHWECKIFMIKIVVLQTMDFVRQHV